MAIKDKEYLDDLWKRYKSAKNKKLKNALKEELFYYYHDWCNRIADIWCSNHNCCSMEDDVHQFALLGLLNAIKLYKPGISYFKTYGYRRITGNIVDCLRREGTYTRGQLKHNNIPVSLEALTDPTNSRYTQDKDDSSHTFDITEGGMSDCERDVLNAEFFEDISTCDLDERELTIFKLHYIDGYNLKETSEIVGVSDSTISQLMTNYIKPLIRIHYKLHYPEMANSQYQSA